MKKLALICATIVAVAGIAAYVVYQIRIDDREQEAVLRDREARDRAFAVFHPTGVLQLLPFRIQTAINSGGTVAIDQKTWACDFSVKDGLFHVHGAAYAYNKNGETISTMLFSATVYPSGDIASLDLRCLAIFGQVILLIG